LRNPAAAIAGALANGGDLDLFEIPLQFRQAQLKGGGRRFAADLQPPARALDLFPGCRQGGSAQKSVVRCDRGLEVRDWCLVIRRPIGQLYQWLLSRQRAEDCGIVDTLRQTETSGGRSCDTVTRGANPATTEANALPIPVTIVRRSTTPASRHIGLHLPQPLLLYGNTDTQGIVTGVNPQPTGTG